MKCRCVLDELVTDPRFFPYRGWHPRRLPAIQQDRSEFIEFVEVLKKRRSCLQIGLGYPGASQWVFSNLFEEAWSVDFDASRVESYKTRMKDNRIIYGNSMAKPVQQMVASLGPFDLVFIDGDKTPEALRDDYLGYAPLVERGGVVAFHDTVPHPGNQFTQNADAFMRELTSRGLAINRIGKVLGISYFCKQ